MVGGKAILWCGWFFPDGIEQTPDARNDKSREFWKKLFEDDSETQNEGAEAEQALNRSKSMAGMEEMVEIKIAKEGEALIARADAGLEEEIEAYLQLWT